MKKKLALFGNRAFYSMVLSIVLPILVQNGFSNFVNMLDNVMVGRLGTEEISGVSIINMLLFVYNLCVFGIMSGAGIFTSQFVGSSNIEGVRSTFYFKLVSGFALNTIFIFVLVFFKNNLIHFYLLGNADGGNLDLAATYANDYLSIMLFSLPLFMIIQSYASTLREWGETLVPMRAGIIAVVVNLVFNWLLIFGNLGFPCLGVKGAAFATLLSRITEFFIVVLWTHRNTSKAIFAKNLYKNVKIPAVLTKKIIKKGSPLFINEALWSIGMAILTQCYSTRGLNTIAGFNIASTMGNLCTVVFYANGAAIGIIIGRLLGAGKFEEACETDRKMIVFSALLSFCFSFIVIALSPLFPKLYNTTFAARTIAMHFIIIQALFLPMDAIRNACYYTLRSGGKTITTFLFDCGFVWLVNVPIALFLSSQTRLTAIQMYFIVQLSGLIKVGLGLVLVHKRSWVTKIVS